ncbi:MAG TPA: glycosyltransferase family 39 protein, partial [Gemmataceae bacterium]|nr:glycosyltransferase family 39 protein [Gemmataceae bacterium]
PAYLATFRGYYYSARLSVILPGYVLHSVLPHLTANLVLHLGLYWISLFAFYLIARRLFGTLPAFLAALCLGANPFFLFSEGQNYVDGFGIAYFLLAALGATFGKELPRPRTVLFLSGLCAGAMVTANLFYAIYLPFLVAWYLWVGRRPHRDRVPGDLAALMAGGIASVVGFAVYSKASGGSLIYLLSSVDFARGFTASGTNPFKSPAWLWLPDAVWVTFPLIVFLGSLALLSKKRSRAPLKRKQARPPEPSDARTVQGLYAAFALLMLGLQISPYLPVLQFHFYTSLLLPLAGVALAGQLAFLLPAKAEGSTLRVVTLAAAFATATALIRLPRAPGLPHGLAVGASLLAGLGLVVVLVRQARGPRVAAFAALVVLMSDGATRLASPILGLHRDQDKAIYFRQVDAAASAVRRVDPTGNVFFWWNDNDDPQSVFDKIAATALSGRRIVNRAFPLIRPRGVMADGGRMLPHLKVAVLATGPVLPQAEAALGGIGLGARLISTTSITQGGRPFTITFLELVRAATAKTSAKS